MILKQLGIEGDPTDPKVIFGECHMENKQYDGEKVLWRWILQVGEVVNLAYWQCRELVASSHNGNTSTNGNKVWRSYSHGERRREDLEKP